MATYDGVARSAPLTGVCGANSPIGQFEGSPKYAVMSIAGEFPSLGWVNNRFARISSRSTRICFGA